MAFDILGPCVTRTPKPGIEYENKQAILFQEGELQLPTTS